MLSGETFPSSTSVSLRYSTAPELILAEKSCEYWGFLCPVHAIVSGPLLQSPSALSQTNFQLPISDVPSIEL